MIRSHMMQQQAESHERMVRSFSTIGLATIVLALVGLVREGVVAMKFGASADLDAFVLSFSIAYFFPTLFTSTFQGTFIPSFHRAAQKDTARALLLANNTLNLLVLCLIVCLAILIISGKYLISLLAPGFQSSNHLLAFYLLVSLIPTLLLTGISEQLKNILNAERIFGFPSFTQILPSLATILAILFGFRRWGIYAFAFGWNIGLLAQTVSLMWCLKKNGRGYRFVIDLKSPELRSLLKESLPYIAVPLTANGILFVDKYFASSLGTGNISYFNYAEKLFRIPWMIIGTAMFTVALPFFSERAVNKQFPELRSTISLTLRLAAFLTAPIAAGMAILSRPLVAAVFQRGEFAVADSINTAIVLTGFMASLLFYSMGSILDRALCALGNTATLMKLAAATLILKIFLAWGMSHMWLLPGLAFSTVPALIFQSALTYYMLEKSIGKLQFQELLLSVVKIFVATFLMAAALILFLWFVRGLTYPVPNSLILGIAVCIGIAVFWTVSVLLKSPEASMLVQSIRNGALTRTRSDVV